MRADEGEEGGQREDCKIRGRGRGGEREGGVSYIFGRCVSLPVPLSLTLWRRRTGWEERQLGGTRASLGHRLVAILDPKGARCRQDRPRPSLTAWRSPHLSLPAREGNRTSRPACSVV